MDLDFEALVDGNTDLIPAIEDQHIGTDLRVTEFGFLLKDRVVQEWIRTSRQACQGRVLILFWLQHDLRKSFRQIPFQVEEFQANSERAQAFATKGVGEAERKT